MTTIGYKGTEEERKNTWDILLFLRRNIDYYSNTNRLLALEKERKVYREYFRDYTS